MKCEACAPAPPNLCDQCDGTGTIFFAARDGRSHVTARCPNPQHVEPRPQRLTIQDERNLARFNERTTSK